MSGAPPPRSGPVTVVTGLPRSGTSLMMQMLRAGGMPVLTDGLRAADEDNPRGYLEYEPVKRTRQDPSWLDAAGGHAVKMVYLLLYDLPPGRPYRVLFMERRLDEVIASQDRMLARRKAGRGRLAPDELARVFARHLAEVTAWLEARADFRVLRVDYGALVRDPRPAAEAVARFLGGGLDAARMAAQVDPALHRRRGGAA